MSDFQIVGIVVLITILFLGVLYAPIRSYFLVKKRAALEDGPKGVQGAKIHLTADKLDDRVAELEGMYKTVIEFMNNKHAEKQCAIHGCRNKNTEEVFIGDICPGCYDVVINGLHKQRVGDSPFYIVQN